MRRKYLVIVAMIALGLLVIFSSVSAVSGASFTTFNAHVDGAGKDVCKNSAINCNIYGAKEYVWLNGGPTANGLGPDGDYFFAVLEPGGQPNPNDQGAVADKNLSDDYDCYLNRTFTITNGEVSAYTGDGTCPAPYDTFTDPHWMDSGAPPGPKPNGAPPYIRLYPYSDTTNPGGVYILAICSLDEGYPVEPRDCKYDAFKVKKGRMEYSFYLNGHKYEDLLADGPDVGDPPLEGWKIIISGTGPDGNPFYAEVFTDQNGFWEWFSPNYTFGGNETPGDVSYTVCEELKTGWTQSYPAGCYSDTFTPSGFDSIPDLDFYNWEDVDLKACKSDGDGNPVENWDMTLFIDDVEDSTKTTGADGCAYWTGLEPGHDYRIEEESRTGWFMISGDTGAQSAVSGDDLTFNFVNDYAEGCTPGFWQGGSAGGQAGGQWLWNSDGAFTGAQSDPEWTASGGDGWNPYNHLDIFCTYFGSCSSTDNMWYFVNPDLWSVNDDFHKAARSLTAAYLNASYGLNYPYSLSDLQDLWDTGNYANIHSLLDAANNAMVDLDGSGTLVHTCTISASGW